jgi:hypothetical protein
MTPGYAKKRDELPYLPYWSRDEVIINAHNFGGGAFSPAVNGKMPVAAWIPSLDTAGNGTTTLTDLTGNGYDGTLTNMDAATDWVADSDAGGVTALEFDGSNDVVFVPGLEPVFAGATNVTISFWVKRTGANNVVVGFGNHQSSGSRFDLLWSGGRVFLQAEKNSTSFPNFVFSSSDWTHFVYSFDGSKTGLDRISAYANGVKYSLTQGGALTADSLDSATRLNTFGIGGVDNGRHTTGRHDDTRIFLISLNDSDASALYAAGRGGDAS